MPAAIRVPRIVLRPSFHISRLPYPLFFPLNACIQFPPLTNIDNTYP